MALFENTAAIQHDSQNIWRRECPPPSNIMTFRALQNIIQIQTCRVFDCLILLHLVSRCFILFGGSNDGSWSVLLPRKAKELGPLEVKRLSKPGLHAVGGVAGLALQVKDTGARSWLLRISIGQRRREIGLGGYPDVTLAQAREKAREMRAAVDRGNDPAEQRRVARRALLSAAASEITFDEAARRWHKSKRREYRNEKHAAQVLTTILTYASPALGGLPVGSISLAHIVQVLEPIWADKTETATRLRGRIENVLSWATVSGFRSGENPARWKGNLDAILPKPKKLKAVSHHPALPFDQIAAFLVALKRIEGVGAKALEFAILTAARSGEVREAKWDEFDLRSSVWTVPAHRMKTGREHSVPLSRQATHALGKVPRFLNSDLVFTAPRGGALSDMTLSAAMRRMGVSAVPHGFRSTFRDWVAERTAYPSDVAEMALAHSIRNKVEAAYRRGDLFDKRRQPMQDWADFCEAVRPPASPHLDPQSESLSVGAS
ncbi:MULTISPECIES: integrase arm-type DNA-binding domain-containing protein [unclassified Mesorhizobium]|uniref:tyrosine-type recombinase/integrase n=1 Tax=unclassified Mesorhizobium TaxID=325217 RepID=UPI00333684DA